MSCNSSKGYSIDLWELSPCNILLETCLSLIILFTCLKILASFFDSFFCHTLMCVICNDQGNMFDKESQGLNPGTVVLLVVMGAMLLFIGVNIGLYMYAQKTLPPKKKKPVSKKKLKKEKLKQGISAPGE